MGDVCELLLYEAARAQLVHEVITPALAAGRTVVCDRFYDSEIVAEANTIAVDGYHPDLTFVFDVPVEEASRRRSGRAAEDRLELKGLAFQEKVAAGFRAIAAEDPARVKLVDAARSIEAIFKDVAHELCAVGVELDDAALATVLEGVC